MLISGRNSDELSGDTRHGRCRCENICRHSVEPGSLEFVPCVLPCFHSSDCRSAGISPESVLEMLDDPARSRSYLVHGEVVAVFVRLSKDLIQERGWSSSTVPRLAFDIVPDSSATPSPIVGRYYSALDEPPKRIDTPVPMVLPDGSVCARVDVTVGETSSRRLDVYIRVAEPSPLDYLLEVDLNDSAALRDPSPAYKAMEAFSRHERHLEGNWGCTLRAPVSNCSIGLTCERLWASLNVQVLEPLQVGWHRTFVGEDVYWSVRIRNRMPGESIIVTRVDLLFAEPGSSILIEQERLPLTVGTHETHSFMLTTSAQETPLLTLTMTTAVLAQPLVFQCEMLSPAPLDTPLRLVIDCPSPIPNFDTFSVSITVVNVGSVTGDLEVVSESDRNVTGDDSLRPILNLDKSARLGTIPPGGSRTVCLHFLALREGLVEIPSIVVRTVDGTRVFRCHHPVYALVVPQGDSSNRPSPNGRN